MNFSKIGIVGWKDKSSELVKALDEIAAWADLHRDVSFFAMDSLSDIAKKPIKVASERTLRKCSLLIAIGGDGTVLSSVRLALGANVPILGVNAGRVGFLAETQLENLTPTLNAISAGDYSTRDRIMIDAKVYHKGKVIYRETVLNEVHIRAKAPECMVNVNVEYNGRPLTEYWADSLLLSTPTGSTAYNLAAGGPIIYPSTSAFVITPVAPSSLSVRPLIIPATSTCRISSAVDVPLNLVFDGRITKVLAAGDAVSLSASKDVTTFIRMKNTGFVNALRGKLGWTGKPKFAHSEKN
ncbi:MAG: NAD(+)/NADH kinase [Fibrobacteraceae bacterium]|nr:NAD(+)/NADH kinase [Fibrobacteraceae bacterium]